MFVSKIGNTKNKLMKNGENGENVTIVCVFGATQKQIIIDT